MKYILLAALMMTAGGARADLSDSGNLVIAGTGTIQGASFSVGGTTFSVAGGSITLGGALNLSAAGIKWADGTTSFSSSTGGGKLAVYASSTTTGFLYLPSANAIPHTTSLPQFTQGYRLLVATAAATTTSDTFTFDWSVSTCEPADNCTFGVACVYQDGNNTPLCCKTYPLDEPGGQQFNWQGTCAVRVTSLPSANTSSHYYTLNVGENGGSCISFNGCSSPQLYGGAVQSTFVVKVLTP